MITANQRIMSRPADHADLEACKRNSCLSLPKRSLSASEPRRRLMKACWRLPGRVQCVSSARKIFNLAFRVDRSKTYLQQRISNIENLGHDFLCGASDLLRDL